MEIFSPHFCKALLFFGELSQFYHTLSWQAHTLLATLISEAYKEY